MMKKILITGASGMIGGLVLELALQNPQIGSIVSITRKASGIRDNKLQEVILTDFLTYESTAGYLQDIDVVYYCLGVYTGAVPRDVFRKITVDYPVSLAKALAQNNLNTVFCLLSGAGADPTEKSKMMFAMDKGAAENQLSAVGFKAFYSFRPAYIYPVAPRNEPNFSYRLFRALYPVLKLFGDNMSIKSTDLAQAIYLTGLNGAKKHILENRDILSQLSAS